MCALYNFKYMIVIRTDNLPPVPGEGEGGEGGERDQQAQHQQEILQILLLLSVANTRRIIANWEPYHGDHAAVAETRAHTAQEADQEGGEHRGQEQQDREEVHL